jgi:integrase
MLPAFERRPMASIRPSEVQAWVRGLNETLSPGTIRVVVQHFRAIMRSAVRDRIIAQNPCEGLKLPQTEVAPVEPLETTEVLALIEALPPRYRALGVLGAGVGLRAGEALGTTPDEIDFLRRQFTVRHQLVNIGTEPPRFAPPKTVHSHRTIPLPEFVTSALALHLQLFEPETSALLFTTEAGEPIRRNHFGRVWRRAVRDAGLAPGTRAHDLRHWYASALIRSGESVKTVQARLGHKSAVVTLDTYGHLWPDSEDRTRKAVDEVINAAVSSACHVDTASG